ncbi:GntG family PLP-dependent aldolase [Telmatospirillum siberiense]|uniref:Threonine aldolase n=1 Tax=Telmatospirillum siberiense TaxID=382514 RepID=A0A2N3PUN5_9PROT|nr:GntG family PLP-dependent aldolase [Telmatospirillum siberiense]PKU24112.1 threonine aldolase [Telmatospirillum siberiense]
MTIDLRSDTVTKPTEAMLERMRTAELGDDSRDGDPTVMALEALAAERTGKEAGLFVASGTMGNLVALLAHADRGGEVLCDTGIHMLRSEMGGIASIAGLFFRTLPARRGAVDLDALADALHSRLTPSRLATGLVWMETSHNDAGGAVLPLEHMKAVRALADDHGAPVHVDGARLFNAACALGVEAKAIADHADSLMFCISKGLSAPIGSLLVGSRDFITRARAFRRMVGGAMRQAGIIAAAGIVALEEMTGRLAEDHRMAKRLARGLAAIDGSLTDPALAETNIVRIDVAASERDADQWTRALAARGVLAGAWTSRQIRCVTHRHTGPAEIEKAIAAFAETWRDFNTAPSR